MDGEETRRMEMTTESSTKEVCKRELDYYLDYVWRLAAHEQCVSVEQWWQRREYLWHRIAHIARRHLATST